MHAGSGERRSVSRDQLGIGGIHQTVDHYRAIWAVLGRNDQQLAVVARLNVAERRGVWHDDRVHQRRHIAGHVPNIDRIALVLTRPPGRGIGDVTPDP